ncbi:hypothetical protein B0T16DRAFT_235738 [Cercophora newfieldiana]|uniref:SCD domain-containing protein n=1 Tax=Cercophora newfieldiana TaxID=92897 RepID=A0AA40CHV6_9PEZI|nr:hypothetical protein B0T16DRAFT_235738 [Cercophora newfieldiana]
MPSSRPPLMETSDNTATSSPAPNSTARRSGRVTKVPEKFAADAPLAAKRKRAAEHDDEDGENESPEDEEDDESVTADDEPEDSATEQPKRAAPKRKKPAASQTARSRKPAAKKPKTNGDASGALGAAPVTHAARLPSRPKKTVRLDIGHDGAGLYADIFASGDKSDDVATAWFHKYQADNVSATTDLVNCILSSAGCNHHVTDDDIRDPENCQNRLADLQNVYAEEGITDYPLMSRDRSAKPFRDLLVGFFKHLVTIMHETGVLYNDAALMENIARWVASMSSSTLRPFRHTATTVALAIEAALVDVAKKLDERISKMTQQVETEKSRKGKNKEKMAAIQKNLDEANKSRDICQEQITDFFETVYVHRYRDIEPKIRTECAEALGSWVWDLPTMFMEPEYLRYLGWLLSDVVPSTRQEVLRQLARIFKRDAEKLGHFIDRFRPRLVEMATKDVDPNVRVNAIAVVQILKDTGMLDPEELDAVGRSIFDPEFRVRKAVLGFFESCVNDSIETKVEEIGGDDAVDELFGEEDEDDYFSPRRSWIAIKCLAEILASYDAQVEDDSRTEQPRSLDIAVEMFDAVASETRITLAAEALYERIGEVKNWEILSGYLLYDHTASAKSKSKAKGNSNEAVLQQHVAPSDGEEPILLQVLATAVELSLKPSSEVDRSRRKPRPDLGETPEEAAVHLATIIPRLLKKYGAEPATAVLVLRLEHWLNLDTFQQLRQDTSTYVRLLDEICTQFGRHVDRGVLAEATASLLHARKCDELTEVADAKISELWEVSINNLRRFDKAAELGARGNLDEPAIAELGHVLVKMSKLATIADCVDVLEADSQLEGSDSPVIDILVRTVVRGKLDLVDEALDDLEDEAVSYAIKCCQFYFMWKIFSLIGAVQSDAEVTARTVERMASLRKKYETNLIWTLSSRGTNDDLRLFATGALCDLHVACAKLKFYVDQDTGDAAAKRARQQKYALLDPLFEPVNPGLINELIEIYDSAERAYARCIKKTLNEPAEDEDPLDDEAFSDDENDEELSPTERKGKELKAERALCDLAARFVLAIQAKMIDRVGPQAGKLKKRMLRNQHKLGINLQKTVECLDERKLRELRDGPTARVSKKAAAKDKGKGKASNDKGKKVLSEEIIVDADDDDEEDPFAGEPEPEPEEGTVEDLRRRELLDEDEEEDHDDGDGGRGDKMDEDEESLLGD